MTASTGWGLIIFIFQIKPKHSINNKMDTTMLAKIVHNTELKNAFAKGALKLRQTLGKHYNWTESGKWPWWGLKHSTRFPTST